MSAGEFGYIIGIFAGSLLLGSVWLIICKIIPPLQNKPNLSYGLAIALASLPPFLSIDGPNILNVIGTLMSIGLFFWQFRRAQKSTTYK
jgi:hypothetical protein